MKLSDLIRNHVITNELNSVVLPPGGSRTLRAGDIHNALGLKQRMPAVVSVLGSLRLQQETGVILIERTGPHAGANARFTYTLPQAIDRGA